MDMRKFLCIGHRGAKGLEPENTLRSIRRALELGVDGVEIDVYFVEGELVVIHDDTLQRTTNGRGKVEEQSFAHLRSLDAGKGEKIPTLAEVFDLTAGKAFVNVELKGRGTAEPVYDLIHDYVKTRGRAWEDYLVSSFHLDELAILQGRELRLGPLFSKPPADCIEIAESLDAWSVNVAAQRVDKALIEDAHSEGLKVLVYTVNAPAEMERLRADGADGIFTDYPDRMKTV